MRTRRGKCGVSDMNVIKLQQDLIARMYDEGADVAVGRYRRSNVDCVAIIINKAVLYLVPVMDLMLPYNVLVTRFREFDAERIISRFLSCERYEGSPSGLYKGKGKNKIFEIESDTAKVWIDVKLISFFDSNSTYRPGGPRDAVAIYEPDSFPLLVGFVMPMNMAKWEKNGGVR